jgi:hypothetical protein
LLPIFRPDACSLADSGGGAAFAALEQVAAYLGFSPAASQWATLDFSVSPNGQVSFRR